MTSTKLILPNACTRSLKDQEAQEENLLDVVAKTASDELREDDATRRQCLIQFREWIQSNTDIQNCLMDDSFLLRFLRARKFSLAMAQQTLLKYLNFRKKFKHIFYDLDCQDAKISELVTNGYIFASPFRDDHGRRVVLTIPYKLDPSRFSSTDMARAHMLTYETLIDEEDNQILGFTYFGDGAHVTIQHVAIWSITEFATLMKWGEQSCPMRHKVLHIINLLPAFKYVVEFGASRVSPKLRDRLKIHNSISDMHEALPSIVLPKEYGGVMPMADMIDLWKKELSAKRDRLLSYDAMNLLSDRGIICRKNQPNGGEISEMQGSFRKLEVD